MRLDLVASCPRLSMWPEVPVRPHDPRRHLHNDFLPRLGADGTRPQFRIFIMLVIKHHDRHHTPTVFLIGHKLCPFRFPHLHTTHEPTRPVVTSAHAFVVL